MAKNTQHLPYTEIQERVLDLTRLPENAKSKIRGVIQDVYLREIAAKYDWDFLMTSSSLTTEKAYNTGTCSVNTGATSVSFSGAVITSGMTAWRLKISGADGDYRFSYVSSSDGTISPAFQNTANASGNSFWLFQAVYPLSPDFDRFPKNGGIYKWQGSSKERLEPNYYQEYIKDYSNSPSLPETYRLAGADTRNTQQIEFVPPPKDSKIYPYDYLKSVKPLKETSAGTITVTAAASAVSGTNSKFLDATTGDWIRCSDFGVGSDSEWYQILAIPNDTTLTIQGVWGSSGATASNYVISSAPELPVRLQPAVMFGAIRACALDQNDESLVIYDAQFKETILDSKKAYCNQKYAVDVPTIAENYLYRR